MSKHQVKVMIRGGQLLADDPIPETRVYTANVLVDDDTGRFLAEAETRIKRNLSGLLVDVATLQAQIPDSNLLLEVVAQIRKAATEMGLG